MPELVSPPAPRPKDDIKADYQKACMELGEVNYRSAQLEGAKNMLLQRIDGYNQEFSKIEEAEVKEAANGSVQPQSA